MANWIWCYGDYEIFHSLLLHGRRQESGASYPTFWNQASVYPTVSFIKDIELSSRGSFTVLLNGSGYVCIEGRYYEDGKPITLDAGKYTVKVRVTNPRGLPAMFCHGAVESDDSWRCEIAAGVYKPVGSVPAYTCTEDNVEVFPFSYTRLDPVATEAVGGGTLYDFGKETFASLKLLGDMGEVSVYYGESREEALATSRDATTGAILFEDLTVDGFASLATRAFRFVYIICQRNAEEVFAEYEYLPIEDKGFFRTKAEMINDVYDVCAYTFHLNSREFYLDGIKRDRWVWSGDAYQSCMINPYLYSDPEIIKRTILCLLGKPPYLEHINTINDYTFYLIITVYDYLKHFGDTEFVGRIFSNLKALYSFASSRLDEDGFVCHREGDWIFIDWSDHLDKNGPHSAEQILLWKATLCMKEMASVLGAEAEGLVDADGLKKRIYEKFYDEQRGGFIDSFASGKRKINRQQNVLALLYDFASEKEQKDIMKKVLCNPEIPPITTPYFEFFELMAMCKGGNLDYARNMLSEYWGGMLKLGATSVWEAYDPTNVGTEHYAMYGRAFGKSLCHAWGSGPILILGKYFAGVSKTEDGFVVKPALDQFPDFCARVPLPGGAVDVSFDGKRVSVCSDLSGGRIILGSASYEIKPNTINEFEI